MAKTAPDLPRDSLELYLVKRRVGAVPDHLVDLLDGVVLGRRAKFGKLRLVRRPVVAVARNSLLQDHCGGKALHRAVRCEKEVLGDVHVGGPTRTRVLGLDVIQGFGVVHGTEHVAEVDALVKEWKQRGQKRGCGEGYV